MAQKRAKNRKNYAKIVRVGMSVKAIEPADLNEGVKMIGAWTMVTI